MKLGYHFLVFAFATLNIFCLLGAADLAVKGGTVVTVGGETIANGTVLIQNGKISQVGVNISIPVGVKIIDASGLYVVPGLIDTHTHIALDMEDANEVSGPVNPQVWMKDILDPNHPSIRSTLSGGVTTVKTMHGSANVIGGVNVVIKLKYQRPLEELIVLGLRPQIKLALGENPKNIYGEKGQMPSTRMGTAYLLRSWFKKADNYRKEWAAYRQNKKKDKKAPTFDDKLEVLAMVLDKKMAVDCHAYRADEIVWLINFCRETGIDLLQISHCTDGYKVADILAKNHVTFGGWVDWWGWKEEMYDGSPWGLQTLFDAGVNMVINSDSGNEGRYLFLNAARLGKYTQIPRDQAFKMITLNAAKALEMEKRIGSIEVGKDGDLALFTKHPLDLGARCLQTIIEGQVFYQEE